MTRPKAPIAGAQAPLQPGGAAEAVKVTAGAGQTTMVNLKPCVFDPQ